MEHHISQAEPRPSDEYRGFRADGLPTWFYPAFFLLLMLASFVLVDLESEPQTAEDFCTEQLSGLDGLAWDYKVEAVSSVVINDDITEVMGILTAAGSDVRFACTLSHNRPGDWAGTVRIVGSP